MSDTYKKLHYENKYKHWKILDLLVNLNCIYFYNSNPNLTWNSYLNIKL